MCQGFSDWMDAELQAGMVAVPISFREITGGDVYAALVLAQIAYWFRCGRDGRPKLKTDDTGRLVLTKSTRQLADWSLVGKGTISRCLDRLVELGLIEVESDTKATRIWLNVDELMRLGPQRDASAPQVPHSGAVYPASAPQVPHSGAVYPASAPQVPHSGAVAPKPEECITDAAKGFGKVPHSGAEVPHSGAEVPRRGAHIEIKSIEELKQSAVDTADGVLAFGSDENDQSNIPARSTSPASDQDRYDRYIAKYEKIKGSGSPEEVRMKKVVDQIEADRLWGPLESDEIWKSDSVTEQIRQYTWGDDPNDPRPCTCHEGPVGQMWCERHRAETPEKQKQRLEQAVRDDQRIAEWEIKQAKLAEVRRQMTEDKVATKVESESMPVDVGEKVGFGLVSPKVGTPEQRRFAERAYAELHDALAAKRRLMRVVNREKWFGQMLKWVVQHWDARSEIKDVLRWYVKHIGGAYVPDARSVESFIAKYEQIAAAFDRDTNGAYSRPDSEEVFANRTDADNREFWNCLADLASQGLCPRRPKRRVDLFPAYYQCRIWPTAFADGGLMTWTKPDLDVAEAAYDDAMMAKRNLELSEVLL